jgi:hypothetical protein
MGIAEPTFRTQLQRLERAAGLPGADIRLMVQIANEARDKVRELGLDSQDTTGPELYQTLKARLQDDEQRVRSSLGITTDSTPEIILTTVQQRLEKLPLETRTFAVKQSAMRAVLKKLQPKTTMKRLGYRSMDSMIKHEPVAQLLAAASLLESRDWQRRRLEAYKKLKARDFEVRAVSFKAPYAKHWPEIAAEYTKVHKHNVLMLPEMGSVVLLPLEHDLPGLVITTLLLGVQSINDMRSLGSYLKLQQVRPDYGSIFATAIQNEPMTAVDPTGEPLPWKMVQWFYGHGHSAYHPEAFQPHVQPEDLSWHDAETVLAGISPALEFWQGNQLLGILDGADAVSMNMLDIALSVCNGLNYGQRVVHHMREALSRELMARYLHQDNLQALLLGKLDEELAPELAFDR